MKKTILFTLLIVLFVSSSYASSQQVGEVINQVLYTDIVTEYANEVIESFNINGSTAIYVKDLKKLGIQISYDKNLRKVTLDPPKAILSQGLGDSVSEMTIEMPVDINNGSIKVPDLQDKKVRSIALFNAGKRMPMTIKIDENEVIFDPKFNLKLGEEYTLYVDQIDNKRLEVSFNTQEDIDLTPDGSFQVIKIPAMPEKGFNYPFFITLPSDGDSGRFKNKNAGKKRYLLVETNNPGQVSNDEDFFVKRARNLAEKYNSKSIAREMYLPRLIPTFPRPRSTVAGKYIYTHSLTRNTLLLDDILKVMGDEESREIYGDLTRVDEQLNAMIDYAIPLLNKYGNNVEEKIFMWGFSASGSFTKRYVALHPERVKAAIYGGYPVLPLETYKGEEMIFPIGVSDYEDFAGKPFNLEAFNQVPQFSYIGTSDDNNPELAHDCYNEDERNLINAVLHPREYPERWNMAVDIFKEAGGQAQIYEYIGAGHEIFSYGMGEDYVNFFEANRDSTAPVYVGPSQAKSVNVIQMGAE